MANILLCHEKYKEFMGSWTAPSRRYIEVHKKKALILKAKKKPDEPQFTPKLSEDDEEGGLPIVPILAVAGAAVGGYFMLKG